MKVLICGAGQVGSTIARQLATEGNHVTVIDQSEQLINNISDTLDVTAIHGHASHPEILKRAGAEDADMLIAVTSADETNMVSCQIAHTLFDIPTKVARLRHQSYLAPEWKDLYRLDHMPIDVIISPEIEVAEAVVRRLHVPGATDMIPYAGGVLKLISLHCTQKSSLINLPIRLIRQRVRNHIRLAILGIVHKGKFRIVRDEHILQPEDEVFFLVHHEDITRSLALFGHEEKEARRVLIVGGGNIGCTIAERLVAEESGLRLKMIELDGEKAREIATSIPDITVFEGSALSEALLEEVNINLVETLIAVTNDDKVNVIASLLGKRLGAQRTITLVNSAIYAPLMDNLGLDVTVNPRETTVSTILQHIRRGKIRGVHAIHDGVAEVLEIEAISGSHLLGKPLSMLKLPEGVMVGALIRNKEVMFDITDVPVQQNDRIIVLAMTRHVRQVEDLFSNSSRLF